MNKLGNILRSFGRCAVAFSGGRDSSFLLKIAGKMLGKERVVAVTAVSAHISQRDISQAEWTATRMGIEHIIVNFDVLKDKEFRRNGDDRCYRCKKLMWKEIRDIIGERYALIDGTTADDMDDFRPGIKASEEAGIISPLKEAGLNRDDIEYICRRRRFFFSGFVSTTCLASRIQKGEMITVERLNRIEKGEEILHSFLGHGVLLRLRDEGQTARIEFRKKDILRFLARRGWGEVIDKIKCLGYRHVAVDMDGYRPAGTQHRPVRARCR